MKEVAILPEQAPVMPLPGAVLFPHALLPLYIFELRYREMLAHALAQERMFCVALLRPESAQWKSEDDFFDIGTIGLIRACVGRGEGTSNLILQGLQRVRFADFVQLDPFPIAELEALRPDGLDFHRRSRAPSASPRRARLECAAASRHSISARRNRQRRSVALSSERQSREAATKPLR